MGTKMVVGPEHAPLVGFAMWKEGIVLVLFGLVFFEWLLSSYSKPCLPAGRFNIPKIRIDPIDLCIIGLFVIALFLSYSLLPTPYSLLFGFKYTLFPFLIFFTLRRAQWSGEFMERVQKILLSVGVIVALYGIFTFFLPMVFFTWLGYSDLHSLYLPGGPLAAFQQIGEMGLRRIQSTFSGPNQMGVWLLIPLGILFMRMRSGRRGIWEYGSMGVLGIALVMTFSRAAWVGVVIMFIVALRRTISRRIVFAISACVVVLLFLFPNILLRSASTLDHIRRPMDAVRVMVEHPRGLGLGSAGPASNRVSDPCVYLPVGTDASWAKDRP